MFEELVRRIGALERRLDGLVLPEVARPVDWSPTVTQLGSVAVTVTYAKCMKIGGLYRLQAYLTMTGSGTAGNKITIGNLPAVPTSEVGNISIYGVVAVYDSSVGVYYGFVTSDTSGTLTFYDSNTRALIGVNPNFGLAAGDIIYFSAAYFV